MIINFLIIIFSSLLILFSPLYYGSVLQISKHLIQLSIITIFTLWLISLLIEKKELKVNILKLSPLIMFLALCCIQAINIPNIIHELLSGKSYEIWDNSRRVISSVSPFYQREWFTLSLYPFATTKSLALVLSYVIFGFFLAKYINNRSKLLIVAIPLVSVAIIELAIGLYQSFIVYGISDSRSAHGTFVNKNHYAGLLELLIPFLIGMGFSLNENWLRGKRNLLSSLLNFNRLMQLLIFTIAALTLFALVLSKSRMGLLSIIAALFLFYAVTSHFMQSYKNMIWFICISALFFLILVFTVDITPILQKFMEADAAARIMVWKDCVYAIWDFHLLGSGLGTFKYVYPLYKDNLKTAVDFNYAHNDYIHLLVETGFIGFSCLMAGLFILLKDCKKFLEFNFKAKDPFGFFITLGALTSIVSILIHSLADFNLHIPSNALYFTVMIGIIYGINSDNKNKKVVRVKRVKVSESEKHNA